jgi:hypothetical protein
MQERLPLILRAQGIGAPTLSLTAQCIESLCAAARQVDRIECILLVVDEVSSKLAAPVTKRLRPDQVRRALGGRVSLSLDARAVTFTASDLGAIAETYFSQPGEQRRLLICIEAVPTQFHPLKVLRLDRSGLLEHYRPEGQRVYRRQQIERDTYWSISRACWVGDALKPPDPAAALAFPIRWHSVLALNARDYELAVRVLKARSQGAV